MTKNKLTPAISTDKVCLVIVKAREFETKDPVMESEPWRTAATADALRAQAEFSSCIDTLTEDERVDLVALTWLGCGTHTMASWPSLRAEARRTYPAQTAAYLLGTPQFANRLETGLSRFGLSPATPCSETA